MERKRVNSSKIRAVGYDPKSQVLEIEFSDGRVNQYRGVSPEVHRQFHGRALADELLRGQDRRELSLDAPEMSLLPYNARFASDTIMEAERINQIASTLSGLNTRSEELRRYL